MPVNKQKYLQIIHELGNVKLVAVSKLKPVEDVQELYDLGQRDFGENYVQEITEKQSRLPNDVRWHFIGHLQSNKVKYIAPFIHLIQGVDSFKLLKEINKQAEKNQRMVHCLLQVHIAQEETKFGFDEKELAVLFQDGNGEIGTLKNIKLVGMMGMASFTEDQNQVANEYSFLKSLFDRYKRCSADNCDLSILSMGMSGDYHIAIQNGSTMVRIGSLLFGERTKNSG